MSYNWPDEPFDDLDTICFLCGEICNIAHGSVVCEQCESEMECPSCGEIAPLTALGICEGCEGRHLNWGGY